jgi:hypothetical protein
MAPEYGGKVQAKEMNASEANAVRLDRERERNKKVSNYFDGERLTAIAKARFPQPVEGISFKRV